MTTTATVRRQLAHTLSTGFQVAEVDLEAGGTLTDLGLDSLDVIELIDLMAASLGHPLPDDTLHPAMTFDEAAAALEAASGS